VDGGATFEVIKKGIPDYDIAPNTMWGKGHPRALAVDPNNPQIVYLGIDGDPASGKSGGGIFKSEDGGATWAQLPNQPGSRRMYYGLAVDPTDSNRLFWGACANGGGIYRSIDQGKTWEHVFRDENFIWSVLATVDGTIYCTGKQLWRSKDHGKTWVKLTDFPVNNRAMVGLDYDAKNPNNLWVSTTTWDSNASGAIYRSTDAGATWQEITGNIPNIRPQILRFNPDTRELWAGFVGVYKIKQ